VVARELGVVEAVVETTGAGEALLRVPLVVRLVVVVLIITHLLLSFGAGRGIVARALIACRPHREEHPARKKEV
jgi:hypothetical protein